MQKIIILVVLLLSFIAIMPANVSGEYIENIKMPSEVKEGESFTVSFDASYFTDVEVYASIGLCDKNGKQILNENGYGIGVHLSETKFLISETPLRRNVKCVIRDQPEGTYKLSIAIYEAETDDILPYAAEHTNTFTLIEGEKDDDSDSSSCGSGVILIIPAIIGLMILIRKSNKRNL